MEVLLALFILSVVTVFLIALAIRYKDAIKDWLDGIDRDTNPRKKDEELIELRKAVRDARRAVDKRLKILNAEQDLADAEAVVAKLKKEKGEE